MNKKSLKIFIILISCVLVVTLGVGIGVFIYTRTHSDIGDHAPKDWGEDPSGIDDEYTARY